MIKIELKTEFGAHEITAADFDESPRPDFKGVVWRDPTRTVRLVSEQEIENEEEDDSPEEEDRPPRRKFSRHHPGSVGPCSFYGIGCFIIVKNGRAIGIMSPKAFAAKYRSTT